MDRSPVAVFSNQHLSLSCFWPHLHKSRPRFFAIGQGLMTNDYDKEPEFKHIRPNVSEPIRLVAAASPSA
jgi:hypothetical protein